MAAIDYEVEYNNRARVPEHPEIFARWARDAAAYRDAHKAVAKLGQSYGPTARQIFDYFPAAGGGKTPLAVFIHGGWWRLLDPTQFSHLAAGLNARGVAVALAGYDLCPQVRISDIIAQMRAVCLFLWRQHKQRLTVFGHSAGGHLTACMVATDWKALAADAPADLVPAGYAISGVFELEPLLQISINQDLRLDASEAQSAAPLTWPVARGRTLDAVVGALESSEFLRQSKIIAATWAKAGAKTRYEAVAGMNHFTILDPLTDADSKMTARVVELAKQVNEIAL